MAGRAFIVMMAFLLSACAASLSQTPQLPKVKMDGNRLVEPEYGYSIEIPNGWQIFDEGYLALLPPDNRKRISEHLNRLIEGDFRAWFFETSGKASVVVFAQRSRFKTKEEFVTFWKDSRHDLMRGLNARSGSATLYNLEFNKFEKLKDLNASYESSDGRKKLSYFYVYSFKQSLYGIEVDFDATHTDFDSYLPLFYDCVKSLTVSGHSASLQERESVKTVDERLEELKQLRDRSLITPEEYEKKKKAILDEL